VYALLPPPGPAAPDPCPGQKWAPASEHAAVQDDVLATLIKVLELVPTSSQRLLPILASNFPHKLRDRTTHCLYLRGLFSLAEARFGAAVREGILASVVDHLIAVDVEIRWEDIVDVVTEEAKEEEGGTVPGEEEPDIFDLEGMSELELMTGGGHGEEDGRSSAMAGGGWEGGHTRIASTAQSTGGAAGTAAAAAAAPEDVVIAVDETADKLDSMMEMTMEYLERRVVSGQLPATWDTTLGAFERTILHTHRSKFVQFLVFYLARYAPEQCCGSLVGLLLARITDRLQPPITRSAAAAYAGSFLARAGFIPEPLVVEALQRLADWCVRYTREEDRRGGLPPIPSAVALTSLAAVDARDRHAAFFAACQALLYALCYHMEPLLKQRARSAGTQSYLQALNNSKNNNNTSNGGGGGANGGGNSSSSNGNHTSNANGNAPENDLNANNNNSEMLKACAQGIEHLFVEAMPRLLTHSLDPLSSCARSVVLEFGRQAGTLGHPELYRIVSEWEQRHTAAIAAAAAINHRSARPLEVFFPYDPYLLRRSAVHLDLSKSYVKWRKGHPTGAPRSGLHGGDPAALAANGDGALLGNGGKATNGAAAINGEDDEMWEDELLGRSSDDDLTSSDDDSDSDSSSSDSSSSSSSDGGGGGSDSGAIDSDSDDDTDDLRRTRFGSMPDSSLSSGGRGGGGGASKGRGRRFSRHRVPGALKASLLHGGAGGSPTIGMPIPGQIGSLSTDNGGSPWGVSPTGGYFGSFAPMSMGK
jgi:RNA polymerase I-specific transcription initiation factor RRN3